MKTYWIAPAVMGAALFSAAAHGAGGKASVEQALELSKRTGRPVLAVLGTET